MITFSCSKCGKAYSLKPEFAGRKTTCSACKEPMVVPLAEATVAPVVLSKIAFGCVTCGTKFNVGAEFAGRSTRCPSCKQPLKVPSPNETVAYAPPAGQIDGPLSSLARVGLDAGITLGNDGDTKGRQTPLHQLLDGTSASRYVIEKELARGGMGAVMCAVDCDIRREVAVKYLLDQSGAASKLRFIEEAQITGQLEHPNIVPIHELGIDAEKRIFFSMKMVKGRSLQDILRSLKNESKAGESEFSQGRLLNVFVNVCNALDYAHTRGVVHRDLKPANIMVGDFGEVYVMDWGLAKVLKRTAPAIALAVPVAAAPSGPFDFAAAPPLATAIPVAPDPTPSASTQIVTSRDEDTDLTRAGAVMGTPVYMPPEQAGGRVHDIDERSDIYSMGAILYEMLTLDPPIDRTGGFAAILLRVGLGQIEPPDKKSPARAAAGKIPPELAAIAMKALAKVKDDRYQSVDAFKRDIERFIEGRSVSAKQDTLRDMAVKLIRRNKGVSIATAAAAVVLFIVGVWSLAAILRANARTQQAYDAYVAEQNEKRALAKKSVPALVRAAKLTIAEKQFDDALAQLNAAIGFDDTEPEARLVRAQLLIANQDYAAARADLEACLKQQPRRGEAKSLLEIVRDARQDDRFTLVAFAEELSRQKVPPLAERMTKSAEKLMASKQDMLLLYQVRIEAAWPGQRTGMILDHADNFAMNFGDTFVVNDLEPLRGMALTRLTVTQSQNIADLGPLKGMPLVELNFYNGCKAADLEPLRGMRLTNLAIQGFYNVRDYSALKGMPLTALNVSFCGISDLSPFAGMKLTYLNLTHCGNVTDLSPLKGMPLGHLDASHAQLSDLSPLRRMPLKVLKINGTPKLHDLEPLRGAPLTQLTVSGCPNVNDWTVLKGMPLNSLDLVDCPGFKDLSILRGMPLTSVRLARCGQVKDLAPLRDMKLTALYVAGDEVTDLEPLRGMPLVDLMLIGTGVADLEPLRNMPLGALHLDATKVKNLTALAGMKLGYLGLRDCPVNDVSPLKGMPLQQLHMSGCKELHDLTPLEGMPLQHITLPPEVTKGLDVIRNLKTLHNIDGEPAEQYWKLRDATKGKGK